VNIEELNALVESAYEAAFEFEAWSYDESEADAVCGFLELHAARTLFHEHPAIPNFHAVAA
jgi:hypothetical protein